LLRITRKFDERQRSKLLLYRKNNDEVPSSSGEGAVTYYRNELLRSLFEEQAHASAAKLLHPKSSSLKLQDLVRREFRKHYSQYQIEDREDAGFAAMRKLNTLWRCYTSIGSLASEEDDEDEEEEDDDEEDEGEDAQDEAIAAAAVAVAVEGGTALGKDSVLLTTSLLVEESEYLLPGIVLVAHPMVQGPLSRSVVLILEHNTNGSYGVVLNRSTKHTLQKAVKNLPSSFLEKFGSNRVAFGGMVRRLQYLHNCPEAAGVAIPLCAKAFYAGGNIQEALRLVENTPEKKNNFHFFVGCCTWDPQQLEQEMAAGYWLPVRTHPDELVALSSTTSSTIITESEEDDFSTMSFTEGLEGMSSSLHLDMWSSLLYSLGDEYEHCASLPHDVDAGAVESLDWYH